MSWLLPTAAEVLPMLRRLAGQPQDRSKSRHRPGYWRDYHARNLEKRRPYLTAKAREYRSEK